jgi:LemA protein
MVVLWIVGAILLVILVSPLIVYNGIVRLKNQVKNSWSTIDVMLKRRADLIPNLVSAVKGYLKHEKNVLEEVTKARVAILHSTGNIGQSAAAENFLESALSRLFMVSENYPKLKSSDNFLSLQNELARTEDEISSARRIYNNNVREYNTKIDMIPYNIIALVFNFKKSDYFKASVKDKENVEADF